MRFVIPKPIHGWRAFWGEVGIIVLGVLIALGAQQLVEEWSDRQRADRAIDAVKAEMAIHDRGFREYEVTAPCVYAQIDVIERQLRDGVARPVPLYRDDSRSNGFVIRLPSFSFSGTAWQSIEGIDTMRLLDPDIVSRASTYYGRLENLRRFNLNAIEHSAELNSLSVMMPSADGDRLRYIALLELLREDISRLVLGADQLRSQQAEMNLAPSVRDNADLLSSSGTLKFCREHHLALGTVGPVDEAKKN